MPHITVFVEVEGGVDLRHGHSDRISALQPYRVAGADYAFFKHPRVKAGAIGLQKGFVEAGYAHLVRQFVTGDARLRDLYEGFANAVAIPHAYGSFQQTVHGQIFAKLAN